VIGVGSSVPNSGDVVPCNLIGIPLIIIRDKEKKLEYFTMFVVIEDLSS